MGKVTVYCVISGCTPEVVQSLLYRSPCGPIVTSAIESLANRHELSSQDDLYVISPVDSSGYPPSQDDPHSGDPVDPEADIRVLRYVMGDSWDSGFVGLPPPNTENHYCLVSFGSALMVQTYALEIMALATNGRMTPLRLWHLAMKQRSEDEGFSSCLQGVDYGAITDLTGEQDPELFSGFTTGNLFDLEEFGDVEVVKQRLVHEGRFWVWMAPDRFPVSPTKLDPALVLREVQPSASRSALESLPTEVLISVTSSLSLASLLNLTSTSWSLRVGILGNDYLARVWMYSNAPWWIPVPTQTPRKNNESPEPPKTYPASQWNGDVQFAVGFPTGLGWAYIMRCMRSGSMRNRKRIWNTVLDIEKAADLEGF